MLKGQTMLEEGSLRLNLESGTRASGQKSEDRMSSTDFLRAGTVQQCNELSHTQQEYSASSHHWEDSNGKWLTT